MSNVVDFIQELKLTETFKDTKFILRPWQQAIVTKIFDTLKPDGTRQYRKVFLFLPRKQGKSQLAAAIGTYSLFTEPDDSEIIVCASTVMQADNIFSKICKMISKHTWLSKQVRNEGRKRGTKQPGRILTSKKLIKYNWSTLKIISSDALGSLGGNPQLVIYDELVAAKTKQLWDYVTSAQHTRTNPLVIGISTAGPNDPNSLLCEQYRYAKQVQADPSLNPSFLPIIYETAKPFDDKAGWFEAMPALGDFCSLEFIESEFAEAKILPSKRRSFEMLYMNSFVNDAATFISKEQWDACKTDQPNDCKTCVAGIDLGDRTDTTNITLYFDNGYIETHYFLAEGAVNRRAVGDRAAIKEWMKEGLITPCKGDVMNEELLIAKMQELKAQYRIRFTGIDPDNAFGVKARLERLGFRVEYVHQTVGRLNAPCKELQALILRKFIKHPGHKVFDWQMRNLKVKVYPNDGDIRPIKTSDSKDSNDGPIALIIALAIYMQMPKESVWANR